MWKSPFATSAIPDEVMVAFEELIIVPQCRKKQFMMRFVEAQAYRPPFRADKYRSMPAANVMTLHREPSDSYASSAGILRRKKKRVRFAEDTRS